MAQVGGVALGGLQDVEAIEGHGRVRQGADHGSAEGGAQVDGDSVMGESALHRRTPIKFEDPPE
ncbi:hypothetical protein [Streptomyces sp. NPDC048282]|uniref:hypothetical protein n=1 Tax=Streptomyces sp. NPDC048282 TaxID=3365528 RepID=UPI003721AFD2